MVLLFLSPASTSAADPSAPLKQLVGFDRIYAYRTVQLMCMSLALIMIMSAHLLDLTVRVDRRRSAGASTAMMRIVFKIVI